MKKALLFLALFLAYNGTAFASFSYVSADVLAQASGTVDLANYPWLILKADARFKTVANGGHVQNANGYDIRPNSGGSCLPGGALSYELEAGSYVASTGAFIMWVKIPTLSHTSTTTIYLCYGDSSLTTDGSGGAMWADYLAVWHFGNGSLSLADSSGNSHTLTNANATLGTGQIGGSAAFNGTNAVLSIASLAVPQSAGMVEAWWNPHVISSNNRPVILANATSPTKIFGIQPYSNGAIYGGWYNNGADARVLVSPTQTVNTWYRVSHQWNIDPGGVAYTCPNNSAFFACNGSNNPTTAVWDTSSVTTYIAYDPGAMGYANIDVDELRIRSDNPITLYGYGWIDTEYSNQSDPASENTYGTEAGIASSVRPAIFVVQ